MFLIMWTVILASVLALEIWGIYHKGPDDTITETFRWWRDKLPEPIRYIFMFIVSGLLMWTILHFWDLV